MSIRHTFTVAALILLTSLALHAADVTGRWTATFTTEVGEQQYTFDFVVKGTQLTGTAKGNLLGESAITDGKVDGDKISFVENGRYMDMPIRVVYSGTAVGDSEIRFTRNVGDFATEELVARRVK